ncbi:helix-turn-helix transcriptional regulator [Fictibacillus nanhaiensis]|uniref:helix-turn-helix transcriptional regulator n=1 Tax=Fictibacillus nanhaiensis TaxID=742169 RepID=UPI002E22DF6F|nr:helix-turn-helix transcriptional regulator [Fictibacillus nanhaiensis]
MIRGEKIKYYRDKLNLTQKVLADGICSISYLSKIENNSILPTEETLTFLCKKLHIDVNELLESSSTEKLELLLSSWYEDIKFRDKNASSEHYSIMKKRIKGISDINLLAQFKLMSARHFLLINQFIEAKILLDEVREILKYLPEKITSRYYYFAGLNEYLKGDLNTALTYYQKVEEKIREPEYYYQLGLIYTSLNKITMSIVNTEKALNEFNKDILFFKVIDCYILLGVNYSRIREYELAISYYNKALKGIHSLKNVTHLKANIFHNLGCVYHSQKKSEEAVNYFSKALAECDNYSGCINTIYKLAFELFLLDKFVESNQWIEKGLALSEPTNQTYYLLRMLKFQVEGKESYEEFRNYVEEEAVNFFQQKNDVINLAYCYEILAKFYYQTKAYKKSSDYFRKCCQLKNNYY